MSNWAKEVASYYGLSKHYNGWKVVYVKSQNRPLSQFRDKYIAEKSGQKYEFPPIENKKRKRASPLFEILPNINVGSDTPSTSSESSNSLDTVEHVDNVSICIS